MKQSIHIEGQLTWQCAQSRDSGQWIALSEPLRLTVQAPTYRELNAAIEESQQLLFADLVATGELGPFLKEHGWRVREPVVIARDVSQLRFAIPHTTRRVPAHDLEAAVC